MNNESQAVLEFTVETAKEAGKIFMGFFGKKLTKKIKSGPNDFATEADVAAEKYILDAIQGKFPEDRILAEESGMHTKPAAEYTWIVDPLDGTRNFASGSKNFAVMIARARGDELELAAIYNPALNLLATGMAGQGSILQGERVHLNDIDLSQKPISVEKNDRARLEHIGQGISNYGASANTLMTLQGERRAYISSNGGIWDFAPPALLLAEAGFMVTNFKGEPYRWNAKDQGVIAAQPALQPQLLALLQ